MKISFSNKKLFFFWVLASGIFFSAPSAHAAIIKPANNLGLVGYWNMDEGQGTTVADHSGQRNSGTTTAAWTSGKLGGGTLFDGVQGEIGVSNPSFMNHLATTGFTVSLWMNPSSLFVNESVFFNLNGAATLYPRMQFGGAGGKFLILQLRTGGVTQQLMSNTAFAANTWYHVTVTFDPATNFSALYINGVLDNSTTFGAGTLDGGNGNQIFKLGHDVNLLTYFGGKMDEVRVYNRPLGAIEANYLYKIGAAKYNSSLQSAGNGSTLNNGLVARYTFDGPDITDKVYDRVGGNNGYFIGAATSSAKTIGRLGQALNLNGSTSYVNLPPSSLFIPSANSPISVSAWIKPSVVSGTGLGNRFFSLTRNGGAGSAFVIGVGSGQASMQVIDAGAVSYSVGGNTNIVANTWYHIVAVFNGSTMSLYVNGRLDTTPVSGSMAAGDLGIGGKIGTNFSASGSFYAGTVDDVRIYNRALSASEVKQLYGQGAGVVNASGATLSNGTSLANGLVSYWSFNGPDITDKVYDRVGGNNGYFLGGATSTAKAQGKLGQALLFNNSYADLGNILNFSGVAPFSVSAWIKNTAVGGTQAIISKFNSGVTGQWLFNLSSTNHLQLQRDCGTFTLTSNAALTPGAWYHVIGVFDGTTKYLYINGALDTSATDACSTPTPTTNVLIGSEYVSSSPGNFFKGAIDEVRVYNRALSASEVKHLYTLGK